jgi:hypothetical protein
MPISYTFRPRIFSTRSASLSPVNLNLLLQVSGAAR